ncbi:LPS export ABC transporter permease LptG [Parvularcula flava]|uniref:LPS export ABC transporter permease LptG n=1 Tax=Aquisalinus luteolus TaxID=1566827 RepID=A0A8J3A6U7_9PROT|nr:LPS export ABC transporter permease LptG [Aquisalinus luteolus]NHK27416.1 LPS export ABC transporter permease LptG [Aquisalinus luteolus]GGH95375.1 LPS export ABC transporter permease LptG [Aquisalinus luteolus]
MPRFTLYRYLSLRTLTGVLGLLIILASMTILIDMIESLREVERIQNAGIGFAAQLTLLRAPKLVLTTMPFIFLFGSMWAFYQLNKRSEVAVMRSAGLSIWGIILPSAILAIVTGIAVLTFADPAASRMSSQAETIKNEIRGKSANLIRELNGGIWLRQRNDDQTLILHASSYDADNNLLRDVVLWKQTLEGVFLERWDAETAEIQDKRYVLNDARLRTLEGQDRQVRETQIVESQFSIDDLREDIAKPETMSIWALPRFIELARDAGLPTVKYELRYHDLLALPIKLLAMVLIAASFSMKPVRSGGTVRLVLWGIAAGFLLFISAEISNATAEARLVPVVLAAWAPVFIAGLLALTFLFNTEDG